MDRKRFDPGAGMLGVVGIQDGTKRLVVLQSAEDPLLTPRCGDKPLTQIALHQVEVRGRVDGYIETRLFQVGSDVTAGQALYELDRRPYHATRRTAIINMAEAGVPLEVAASIVGTEG